MTTPHPRPGSPTPPPTPSAVSTLPQLLLWSGLALIMGGLLVQVILSFILSNSSFELYRALGWLNMLSVLTPIGTVVAVIGGAAVGTRMALREAGLVTDPANPTNPANPANPAGPTDPGGRSGGHPGQGPYPAA